MNTLTPYTLAAGLLLAAPALLAGALPERISAVEHHTARCVAPPAVVNCEVSAVAKSGATLVLANDKPVASAQGAAVFTLGVENGQPSGTPTYLHSPALAAGDKYEALTTSLDGRYVIASTAFNKDATALNTLVYWPAGVPAEGQVLAAAPNGSSTLREQIQHAIGAEYFQVEGLTVAPSPASPDGQLILGIRKAGLSSANAASTFLLVAVPIRFNEGVLELQGRFSQVLRLSLNEDGHPLGLSGLEYDRFTGDRLYAVTSFEEEARDSAGNSTVQIGGYLWVLPLRNGEPGTPQRLNLPDGNPLRFSNKPEGVELLDARHLLVVHDDDRVNVATSATGVHREGGEFAYSVITLP